MANVFECLNCGEEITVPDTVPAADVDGWLQDHDWTPNDKKNPVADEWLCPDCSGNTDDQSDDPD